MTARKEIKKQHRLQREERRRALGSAQMRRRLLALTATVLAVMTVVALAAVLAPWSSSGEADENIPTVALTIGDNFFRPDTVRVQAGQEYRVQLTNGGQNTHDIWFAGNDNQSATGDDVQSDPIPGGGAASVRIKYDNPGTYYFVCTFHAGQGGTLVVEQLATPERSPQ
jgi:plastocyanin